MTRTIWLWILTSVSLMYGMYSYSSNASGDLKWNRDKDEDSLKQMVKKIDIITTKPKYDGQLHINKDAHVHNLQQKCFLSHGATRIEVPCRDKFSFDYTDVNNDPTVIETDKFPVDLRIMPEVGNGHIATIIHSDTICMNGLYNGANTSSHRARIPSIVNVIVDSIEPSRGEIKKKYILDMKRGVFRERFYGDDFRIEVRTYAHRLLSRVFVVAVDIQRNSSTNFTVKLHTNTGPKSADINFSSPVLETSTVYTITGETKVAEYPDVKPTTPVVLVYNALYNMTLPPSIRAQTSYFLSSIGVNKNEALSYFAKATDLIVDGTLLVDHVEAWDNIWNHGRVDVDGNVTLARSIYSSFYYLLSSLPVIPDPENWPFMGLAPGGLAHGYVKDRNYDGHVFWDQDTWMFPPIMLLHSAIGKIIIQSRLIKLNAANQLAKMRGFPFPAAVYPWESAYTGLPTAPSETCSVSEIHISADVSFALRQYLFLTNDTHFLHNGGAEALIDLATFWAARVTLNPVSQLYEILDVVGPDEYHYHVNNSVYTNTAAKIAVMSAQLAMTRTGHTPPRKWQDIIDHMYIPLDEFNLYHPEFDGYTRGTIVKQADAILLGYPLMDQDSSRIVQRNDLLYYSTVTPRGPAMTWGIFAVNWLEQGNQSLADRYFHKQFDNIQLPFYTWTENADGTGAVNFHTGMGGFLQSVLFGYGGFRIMEDMLIFNPHMIPSVPSWNITGVDYGVNSFDFKFDQQNMYILLTVSNSPVAVYLFGSGTKEICIINKTMIFLRQKAALVQP